MKSVFDNLFSRLSIIIKTKFKTVFGNLKKYFKKLLFPVYLFPIKLVTYSLYYFVKFLFKFVLSLIKVGFDAIIYPFKSLKNFLKSLFIVGVTVYMCASLLVIGDYLTRQYGFGWWNKFFCSVGINTKLQNSVVRIVGGYSEGSGFFIEDNKILTNFHVIADEPSPKVILPDGNLVTPIKIIGDSNVDLAVLEIKESYSNMVFELPDSLSFSENEPLIATGYPLGTELTGKATVLEGRFIDLRESKNYFVGYIQSDISVVNGMSGGPLTNQCGDVVGINTLSLAGLSLFITAPDAKNLIPNFTDQEITKIEVDPSLSPEDAVYAFYTYLKARRMEDGFNLLSEYYLTKTNFEEWTSRFTDILDVDIYKSERFENSNDTVAVKFSTKNWVSGEVEEHFYEGTWETVKEDEVYKMNKSKIIEVYEPDWNWYYE